MTISSFLFPISMNNLSLKYIIVFKKVSIWLHIYDRVREEFNLKT